MRQAWIAMLVVVVAAAGSPEPAAAAGPTWHEEIQLSDYAGYSTEPDIVVSGNVLHVAWLNNSESPDRDQIVYRRSLDGGATWEEAVRLRRRFTSTGGGPSLAVSGDTVHIAWIQNSSVRYRRSQDGGTTWSRTRRLSSRRTGHRDRVDLSVAGDLVHAVWGDTSRGDWEILYRRSTDGGETWRRGRWLTNTETWAQSASVAARGKKVHVVYWQSPGRYEYRRSDDGGRSWSDEVELTGPQGSPSRVAIATGRSSVSVAWFEWIEGGYQVMLRLSSDRGRSWGAQTPISPQTCSSAPAIAATGDRIHVFWSDCAPGNQEIFYKRSPNGGQVWTGVRRLTSDRQQSIPWGAAAESKAVHVVWRGWSGNEADIFYRRRA